MATLHEITIEGNLNSSPSNANDLWCEGFMRGFNDSDSMPERPLMIKDELADTFFLGVASGQNAKMAMQADLDEYCRTHPSVDLNKDGETYSRVERKFKEIPWGHQRFCDGLALKTVLNAC
jgi:hypothetical protein